MSNSGRIYCLISPSLFKCYIGSTSRTLEKRLSQHKCPSNITCNSKPIIEAGDYKMFLIEEVNYNDRKDLYRREGEWISCMKDSGLLVNKMIAGRTQADWYKDNRDLTLTRSKKRVEDNKEAYNNYQREYQRERAREKAKTRTDEERKAYNAKRNEYRRRKKQD